MLFKKLIPLRSFYSFIIKKEIRISQKEILKVMESTVLMPPKSVRGLTDLDRDKFKKTIKISKLYLGEYNSVSSVLPYIKKYLLKMENLKPFQNNIALLNPVLIKSWNDIDFNNRENLIALGINERNIKTEDITLVYENWQWHEIFKAVLPIDKETLSSFSKIGHIIHVNLKNHLLPYKKLIGEVLLDKIKECKTVVNKTENIQTKYRFFQMELLAGENNMECTIKENHCRFQFDFSTVYWNPRLCTEHERITNIVKENDIVYDIFAGVGPFAVPCAKKCAIVLANDLNPDSFKWLNHNRKFNKINEDMLITSNKDGRDFILNDLRFDLIKRIEGDLINDDNKIHIVMNLPGMAVEFLNAFFGLLNPKNLDYQNCQCDKINLEVIKESLPSNFFCEKCSKFDCESFKRKLKQLKECYLPIVHCYCFVKGDNVQKLARDLVEQYLEGHLKLNSSTEIFNVRNVSPRKDMMRVSFRLTREYLLGRDPLSSTDKKRKNRLVDDKEIPVNIERKRYCSEGEIQMPKETAREGETSHIEQ